MQKYKACNIIEKNRLIPGPISREILNAIIHNQFIDIEKYKNFISLPQFEKLHQEYQTKKKGIEKQYITYPKYLPFYYLIKDRVPSFQWELYITQRGKPGAKLISPRVENLRPSLLSLLLGKVDEDADCRLNRKYDCTRSFPKDKIKFLSNFLEATNAIYPSEEKMHLLIDWIRKALKNQDSVIFTPICPDYSVEATGNPACPFRHTFNSLGCGIDPVGLKILDILPLIKELLVKLEISPKLVFALANFEAFSEKNLNRLGITEDEFIKRVELSRLSLIKKTGMPFFMMTEIFGGKEKWILTYQAIKKELKSYQFGLTGLNQEKLRYIANKRRALYTEFYGEKSSLDEYIPIVLEQGIEYATMGFFITRHYKNCLILGADNPLFEPFYSFSQAIPSLYVKRYYM